MKSPMLKLLLGVVSIVYLYNIGCAQSNQRPLDLKKLAMTFKSDSMRIARKKTAISYETWGTANNIGLHVNQILLGTSHFFLDADAGVQMLAGIYRSNTYLGTDKVVFTPTYMGSVSANIGSENAYFFAGMGVYKGNIDNEFHNYIAPKHPTYFILGLKHQPYNSNLYFKIFMMPHWAEYKDMIWDYPLTYAHKRTMSCRVGVSLGYAFNAVSKSKLVLATNPIQKRYKNAVFLQLLGDSYLGGIGYSRILLDRKSFFWDIRGILTPSFNLFPTSWIGSSLNFGKNKHYLETGVSYNWWANSESYRHENQMNMINSITPVVGYKLLTNHFFLRASFTPMISNDFYKKIMPWGGVSIGGTF